MFILPDESFEFVLQCVRDRGLTVFRDDGFV